MKAHGRHPGQLSLDEGMRLRDEGIAQVSRNGYPLGSNERFLREARREAVKLARTIPAHEIAADDLYDRVPLPDSAHQNLWGAVFAGASRYFDHCGFRRSRRPGTHARVVGVWRLKQEYVDGRCDLDG